MPQRARQPKASQIGATFVGMDVTTGFAMRFATPIVGVAVIISASYRTDIPALYGRWFLNRLAAGSCQVANPYGGRTLSVDLRPSAVDGFVFWTRNIGPFRPALDELRRLGLPFVVQMTITGYPRALEVSVTETDPAIAGLRAVAETFGPRAVVWRYDPILITDLTPAVWHAAHFRRIAAALAGATDEVVVSFAEIYRKTARNLNAAAKTHAFSWAHPDQEAQATLLSDLAAVAGDCGMDLTLCTQPDLAGLPLRPAQCIDAQRLSDVAQRPIVARQKGNRPGCLCAESRDIGAYDSCPQGCVYCYAVQNRDRARDVFRAHDPDSPGLAQSAKGVAARAPGGGTRE